MIQEAIKRIVDKENISQEEAYLSMQDIMSGKATPSQIAAFIIALRMKGETIEEIAGCAKAMREAATKVNTKAKIVIDTCGTGGDAASTFNISTVTALIVAGAGFTVAKHGNRSVSSKCGCIDVLEGLGIKIDVPVSTVERCLDEIGIGILFAPALHPAMKYAMPTRKELGLRTIFNILGPITNPAGAQVQLLGVYSPAFTETLATVLKLLGTKQAMVVHGAGLDEITTTGETKITELDNDKIYTYTIKPEQFGITPSTLKDIHVSTKEENIKSIEDILSGKKGPKRDIAVINSAAAILLASRATGKRITWEEAIKKAHESIDSGNALTKLQKLLQLTNQ